MMKSLVTVLAGLALCTSVSVAADEKAAGDKPRRDPEAMFKKLDTNDDKSVSLEEFKAGPMAKRNPDKADENFKKRDKDSNNSLSLEEFKAGQGERRGNKKPEA